MVDTLKRLGVKFMIRKYVRGHVIQEQNQSAILFDPDNTVADNLDYDEAVALIRILEGDKYE